MPSQSSNPKKPRIRNLKKIQAEQNGYILSEEDLSTLQHWKATLTPLTWKKYASCILTVCDYYVLPIHDMTPDLWINYINKILPNQLNTCKISKFSYNSYRYAILNFLDFYGMQNPDFKNIREQVAKIQRGKLQNISAKQNGFTLDSQERSALQRWGQLLNSSKTRQIYISCILDVCEYYKLPIHEITPESWIHYVNKVLPMQIVNREISVSTSRICYYAIAGFLDFYSSEDERFLNIKESFLNPANAPTPKVSRYPTASQMAMILQAARETDQQAYLAMLLAYECALTISEIIDLKSTDFTCDEDGNCMLHVSGSSERLLIIRADLMEQVEEFFLHGGYMGDDWLFHNIADGNHISASSMQRYCHNAQVPLIESGVLLESYPLRSIRSAAMQRMMATDGAGVSTTAQYIGISERYVSTMKSTTISAAIKLPGTRHGYSIADLINRTDDQQTKEKKV